MLQLLLLLSSVLLRWGGREGERRGEKGREGEEGEGKLFMCVIRIVSPVEVRLD